MRQAKGEGKGYRAPVCHVSHLGLSHVGHAMPHVKVRPPRFPSALACAAAGEHEAVKVASMRAAPRLMLRQCLAGGRSAGPPCPQEGVPALRLSHCEQQTLPPKIARDLTKLKVALQVAGFHEAI